MTIKSTNHLTHIATFCALLYSNSALCAELVEYDHTFLMGKDASNIDLSRYTEGNPTLPGIYDVSVYVNDQPIMSQSDAPRDKCTLSCAINGIHAAFHYLKKNYISGCVMTVPTG